jgi:hypothetical protein
VVTEGAYSDYRIAGVYQTPEGAGAALDEVARNGRVGRVEFYPLDKFGGQSDLRVLTYGPEPRERGEQ